MVDSSAAYAALYGPVGLDAEEGQEGLPSPASQPTQGCRDCRGRGFEGCPCGHEDSDRSRENRHRRNSGSLGWLLALRARCLHDGLRHLQWHVASFLVHRRASTRALLRTLHAGELSSEAVRGSAEPQS
jgi:hypothetical protein